MITEFLTGRVTLGAFALSLLIFGFAPGMVLALIVRMIPDWDRREELQAELYTVPRWERPYWVFQQLEVAIRIGAAPQVSWWWNRNIWHRSKIESGVESHNASPDTFHIPSAEEKAELRPGDTVKLMWSVRRSPGERMWVTVTQRNGDRLVGTLNSWAICAYLEPGETIKFHIDDVIDLVFAEESAA